MCASGSMRFLAVRKLEPMKKEDVRVHLSCPGMQIMCLSLRIGERERDSLVRESGERDHCKRSPDFGGGVDYYDHEGTHPYRWKCRCLEGMFSRESERTTPPRVNQPRTLPKIKTQEVAPCIPRNRYEIGSVKEPT